MVWDALIIISKVLATFFLTVSGFLLLVEWKQKTRKSLFYWGMGLLFWAIITFFDIFIYLDFLKDFSELFLIRRVLLAIAFVLFFLHGTVLLLLPEKYARPLIFVLFGLFVYLDFYFNDKIADIYMNHAIHNVYFINPLSLVFFFLFLSHFVHYQKKEIVNMGLSWGTIFTVNILLISAISSNNVFLRDVFMMLTYVVSVWISFAFFHLKNAEEHVWHKVSTPHHYVVDWNIEHFLEGYIGAKAKDAEIDAMKSSGAESLSKMTDVQKGEFIDRILDKYFMGFSDQRKEMLKTKLISLVGMKDVSGYWDSPSMTF